MKKVVILSTLVFLLAGCNNHSNNQQGMILNKLEYFEKQGANVLVYSNRFTGIFNDEKTAGIEIIHHGIRTATGGAVRLSNTPEQWDLIPVISARTVDSVTHTIEATLRYAYYDFESRIVATAKGDGVEISVYLDKPVPAALEGHAGFNLEFLPSHYWGKKYLMDGRASVFPRYATSQSITRSNSEKIRQFNDYRTYDDRGTDKFVDPLPLETGRTIILAPDAPDRMVKINSPDADMMLYDGRILAQNGWYVVRSLLPTGKTGKVLTWTVEPNAVDGWIKEPNIGFSQVGYIPAQAKVSVIELDKNDKPLAKASLYKIADNGKETEVFSGKIIPWGDFYRHHYVKFDFSSVRTPGIYYIKYGKYKTNTFLIGTNVYDNITHATTDVWFPVHMEHMLVREGYRVWHGNPFKDDAIQAPVLELAHFDNYMQRTTHPKYKPYERIPGLNVGGWFDAGDYDIQTGTVINGLMNHIQIWENFKPMRDQTFIDQKTQFVEIHRPDGVPDILQQIEHGTLQIVAQAENIGWMGRGIVAPVLNQYHHLGDAVTQSDGLIYDPKLGPYEISADGRRSGRLDDRWVFNDRNANTDLNGAAVLAAASRALKGYNDNLSDRALKEAKRLFKEATELLSTQQRNATPGGAGGGRMGSGAEASINLQMYITTEEKQYVDRFEELIWPMLESDATTGVPVALQAVPYMNAAFKDRLRPYMVKYKEYLDQYEESTPYGVPVSTGRWAGTDGVSRFGNNSYYAHKHFPDIVGPEYVFKALNFLFGCHPVHNLSFVATSSAANIKNVHYGQNRADFTTIPGVVTPGALFFNPDFFENKDDWPFLWAQNEGTQLGGIMFVHLGHAANVVAQDVSLNESISKIRKGELVVKAKKGANVTVEQLSHEFWFGCAIPDNFAGGMSEDNLRQFKEKFLLNFNAAVFENALKWAVMERQKDQPNYRVIDAILAWTEENNIPLRGHCLFWGIHRPNSTSSRVQPWVTELNDDELRQRIKDRAETIAKRYKGRFAEYDLNNEMLHGNYFEDRLGPEITKLMAQWVHNEDPDAKLWLNDYDILIDNPPLGIGLPEYMAQIRRFLKEGVPIAGIGVQGHSHLETFDRAYLKKALDSLAIFNLPIRITEFNMPGMRSQYRNQRVPMTPEQEELRAKEIVDYFRICFAHPAVEGILIWGFWEGANWIPASSLYKRDWTPTPSAHAYRNLLFNEWWTKKSGTADGNGNFSTQAFYGKYRITVDGVSKEVNLSKEKGQTVVDFRK